VRASAKLASTQICFTLGRAVFVSCSQLADASTQNALHFDEGASGGSFDKETNLHYNYYRWYDPGTGRYTTFDPIGLRGGINGYGYVGGDPLSFADPFGLETTISLYSGAGGFGHIGIGVNTPGTVGYYPNATAPGNPITGQTGIVQNDDPNKLISTIKIPTTPQQEQKIQTCIDQRSRNPGTYKLTGNNCRAFVQQCLSAGGINANGRSPGPRPYFDDLQTRFGGN
jgi:RHS repeat-associated protein